MLIEETISQKRKYLNQQEDVLRWFCWCWLLWCCSIKSVGMISSTELLADHPAYPGIMRYKHSLHHQQLHHTVLWSKNSIWPDNFESERADHYKSNRHSLDWKPGWNAVFEFVYRRRRRSSQWKFTLFLVNLSVVGLQTGWSLVIL